MHCSFHRITICRKCTYVYSLRIPCCSASLIEIPASKFDAAATLLAGERHESLELTLTLEFQLLNRGRVVFIYKLVEQILLWVMAFIGGSTKGILDWAEQKTMIVGNVRSHQIGIAQAASFYGALSALEQGVMTGSCQRY